MADWDSAGLQFREFRDHNKDGFIDKDELMVGYQFWFLLSLIKLLFTGLDTSQGIRSRQS